MSSNCSMPHFYTTYYVWCNCYSNTNKKSEMLHKHWIWRKVNKMHVSHLSHLWLISICLTNRALTMRVIRTANKTEVKAHIIPKEVILITITNTNTTMIDYPTSSKITSIQRYGGNLVIELRFTFVRLWSDKVDWLRSCTTISLLHYVRHSPMRHFVRCNACEKRICVC